MLHFAQGSGELSCGRFALFQQIDDFLSSIAVSNRNGYRYRDHYWREEVGWLLGCVVGVWKLDDDLN